MRWGGVVDGFGGRRGIACDGAAIEECPKRLKACLDLAELGGVAALVRVGGEGRLEVRLLEHCPLLVQVMAGGQHLDRHADLGETVCDCPHPVYWGTLRVAGAVDSKRMLYMWEGYTMAHSTRVRHMQVWPGERRQRGGGGGEPRGAGPGVRSGRAPAPRARCSVRGTRSPANAQEWSSSDCLPTRTACSIPPCSPPCGPQA